MSKEIWEVICFRSELTLAVFQAKSKPVENDPRSQNIIDIYGKKKKNVGAFPISHQYHQYQGEGSAKIRLLV